MDGLKVKTLLHKKAKSKISFFSSPIDCASSDESLIHLTVQEYCNKGTLSDVISSSHGKLEAKDVHLWAHQLCSALAFVHKKGYLHRNVHTKSIFIHETGHILKLGGFEKAVSISR